MLDIAIFAPVLVPVIIGVVAAFKGVGVDSRWAPVLAIVLGILGCGAGVATKAISVTGSAGSAADFYAVLYGLMSGLSAVGLYSGFQTTVQGKSTTP